MPFRPLQDYILIKPIKRKESDNLQVISHEKYGRGVIIAVGPGERLTRKYMESQSREGGNRVRLEETGKIRPMEVNPGDFIIYGDGTLDYMYPKYFEDGIEYRILQDKDVCVVTTRDQVDPDNIFTDEQIAKLIALHNKIIPAIQEEKVDVYTSSNDGVVRYLDAAL